MINFLGRFELLFGAISVMKWPYLRNIRFGAISDNYEIGSILLYLDGYQLYYNLELLRNRVYSQSRNDVNNTYFL
jgi:hypothetical protein